MSILQQINFGEIIQANKEQLMRHKTNQSIVICRLLNSNLKKKNWWKNKNKKKTIHNIYTLIGYLITLIFVKYIGKPSDYWVFQLYLAKRSSYSLQKIFMRVWDWENGPWVDSYWGSVTAKSTFIHYSVFTLQIFYNKKYK